MDSYNVNSFTTFTSQFNATMIQVEPMLLSDSYEIKVEFVWCSPEIAKGNSAFLKIKFFLEDYLHQSIFTHKSAPIKFADIENKIVVFPYVPTSDIIAMTIHSKLNAIADGALEVVAVTIGTKQDGNSMTFTYADEEYPALPSLKEWVDSDKYYYNTPWWGRNSAETQDYEVDENTDLTAPPKYDTVLDDIEKVVMGELQLKEDGGEVVEINAWKPEIVKD